MYLITLLLGLALSTHGNASVANHSTTHVAPADFKGGIPLGK